MRSALSSLMFLAALPLASCAESVQPEIEVTPSTMTLVNGQTTQLSVGRRYPGGVAEHVLTGMTYSTSDRSIAMVSNTGLVTAGAGLGMVVVRATDVATDATGTVTIQVEAPRNAPAELAAIGVTPNPAMVLVGQTVQLTARGFYTDGTTRNLTRSEFVWSSSNDAVVKVDLNGLATTFIAGEATLTASGGSGFTVKGSAALKAQ